MEINKKLLKDITQYCEYNNIENINEEINKFLQIGFNVVRYGTAPFQEYVEEKPKKPKTTKIKKEDTISEKIEIKEETNISSVLPTEEPKKTKIRIIKNK